MVQEQKGMAGKNERRKERNTTAMEEGRGVKGTNRRQRLREDQGTGRQWRVKESKGGLIKNGKGKSKGDKGEKI